MRKVYEPLKVLCLNHLPGSTPVLGSPKGCESTRTSILFILIPDTVWFGMSKSQLNGESYLN